MKKDMLNKFKNLYKAVSKVSQFNQLMRDDSYNIDLRYQKMQELINQLRDDVVDLERAVELENL